MNTSIRTPSMRTTARIAGAAYLVTFVASIPTLALKDTIVHNPHFVLGAGSTAPVMWAVVLDIVCALAGVVTAVALFPVVRRHGELAARGFIASRIIEAAMLFVGVIGLLAVVTLRHDMTGATGANAVSLVTTARALVAVHTWSFLTGPGIMPAVNALCLGTVIYRSRLVPRFIPTLGLVGAPLLLASALGTIFGLHSQVSSSATLLMLPIGIWELSLGLWMTFKGFRTVPEPNRADASEAVGYGSVAA